MSDRQKPWPAGPWEYIGNSWQHTTIYAAGRVPLARLDLEDWGVTEDNQDELEKKQADLARLIAAAPEMAELLDKYRRATPSSDLDRKADILLAKLYGDTPEANDAT